MDGVQIDLTNMNLGWNLYLQRVKLSQLHFTGETVANTVLENPGGFARGTPSDVEVLRLEEPPCKGLCKTERTSRTAVAVLN